MFRRSVVSASSSLVPTRAVSQVARSPVLISSSWFSFHATLASSSNLACGMQQQRRCYSATNDDDDFDEEEDEGFKFDSGASMATDVKKSQQGDIIDTIIAGILGAENVTEEASAKVKDYLIKFPINNAIVADKVKITHTVDDKGAPLKCTLPDMPFDEALVMAKENGLDLVQLSIRDGLAFCRMRDEKPTIQKLVLGAVVPGAAGKDGGKKGSGPQEPVAATNLYRHPKGFKLLEKQVGDVEMTDVSDDHYCKWKGKKVVEALKKGHPIRVTMKQFQTVDHAISQLKRMLESVKRQASEPVTVPFHVPSVKAASDSVAILLHPVDPAKQPFIKVLSDRDWEHHATRMNTELGDRSGTYVRRTKKGDSSKGKAVLLGADGKMSTVDKKARAQMMNNQHYEETKAERMSSGDFWKK